MSIEVRHLSHVYGEGSAIRTVALEDISFTVREGEFVGIVGHTGSGKSTLVQHLNGLLKPTSGQVLVDGEDLNGEKVNRRALRQRIGLVFQYPEYQLFEETVAKDIAFGPKNQKLEAAEIDRRVRKAMESVRLDYDTYAEKSPFELSGGQMRRAAIAGVLAMEPEVLILDEPTAGLDPRGQDRILSMLEDLREKEHKTILMVSHSMEDMARLADRLLVISGGKLAADGSPREIFSDPALMTSVGLDVPEAAKLCMALRAAGYDLPEDLYKPEELRERILAIWKEGAAC
ncbi:MAG: energy-coupling factor transporter ATPase [Clostridia bacterium]|nr:energy-coupling factor transporter ATPase [Clostridia bacterium]